MNILYVSSSLCVFFLFHLNTIPRSLIQFHPPGNSFIYPPNLFSSPSPCSLHVFVHPTCPDPSPPVFPSSLPISFSSFTSSCSFSSLSTHPTLSLCFSFSTSVLFLPLAASCNLLLLIINLQSTKHVRCKCTHSQAHAGYDMLDTYTSSAAHKNQHFQIHTQSFTATKPGSYVCKGLREKRQLSYDHTNRNTVPNPLCRSLFAVHKSMHTN